MKVSLLIAETVGMYRAIGHFTASLVKVDQMYNGSLPPASYPFSSIVY